MTPDNGGHIPCAPRDLISDLEVQNFWISFLHGMSAPVNSLDLMERGTVRDTIEPHPSEQPISSLVTVTASHMSYDHVKEEIGKTQDSGSRSLQAKILEN